MSNNTCGCRRDCTFWALIVSLVIGVLVAFLTVTAVIVLTPVVAIVALGFAAVYLVLLAVFARRTDGCCRSLRAVLVGILVTIAAALTLLAFSFAATSIIGAIVTGILAAAASLTVTASACYVSCTDDCSA